MHKGLILTALAAVAALGAGFAQQSKPTVVIPIEKTSAANGKQMYINYCASCHGLDGKGIGPVAPALKNPPADLTMLSKNNGGKYPATHVVAVLQYGSEIPSHGTAQMPVWGPILGKMDQGLPSEKMLRINNLSRYIETMQVK